MCFGPGRLLDVVGGQAAPEPRRSRRRGRVVSRGRGGGGFGVRGTMHMSVSRVFRSEIIL